MVLGGKEGEDISAIGQGEDGELLPSHALLDHHLTAGLPEPKVLHHLSDGMQGLILGVADDGALSGGQARGLDHDGRSLLPDVILGRSEIPKNPEFGRGDSCIPHELLRVGLGRLDASRR